MKLLHLIPASILFLGACTQKKETVEKTNLNPYYDKAFDFREKNKPDSAFLYFNKAKDLFLQQNDSLGTAKCLVNMAIISTDKGDSFGAQELALNAQSYFHEENVAEHVYIKSNLNNLGITFYDLKNYPRAIEFYQKSMSYNTDSSILLGLKNNIANAYRRMNLYEKSIAIYKTILKQPLSRKEYAKIHSNYAYTVWLKQPNFNAAPELLEALKIRKLEKDNIGLNSSYGQLTHYFESKNPTAALQYAYKMYETAVNINNADDKIEALQKIIKLSPPAISKKYFELYEIISDSVKTARRTASNQFAVIRYESEKNKAENLNLQKENTERKYQVATRELLLFVGFITVLAASVVFIIWYRKRKEKMKSDAQKAIAESQLKTSKKVHDVVANGLYRIMTEIENENQLDKEIILDKIESLYEKSRDISYDKPISASKPFADTVSELLTSFATEKTKILIAGNEPELWQKTNEHTQYELIHIIQELMVNMKKHSKASLVALRFEQDESCINLYYTDNGKGMAENTLFGNGLRYTGNRIEEINGAITFDTKMQNGLKILITFPFS